MRAIVQFENILLLLVNGFMISSVINYFGHEPNWWWLLGAGLVGLCLYYYPKKSGITAAVVFVFLAVLFVRFESIRDSTISIGEQLMIDIIRWEGIYDFPGAMLTFFISIIVGITAPIIQQFYVNNKGINLGTVVLGLAIYIWLWFQHYQGVERELLMFLCVSVPLSSLYYLGNQSNYIKLFYKFGVVFMGILVMLFVSLLPYEIGPVTFEAGYEFVDRYFPSLHELRGVEGDNGEGAVEGENGELEDIDEQEISERQVGYQPGGPLGGALTASTDPVAEISLESGSFPVSLYLRGRASDYYDGSSWDTVQSDSVEDLQTGFEYVDVYDEELEVTIDYYQEESDLFGLFPSEEIELEENDEEEFIDYEESLAEIEIDDYGNISYAENDFQAGFRIQGRAVTERDLDDLETSDELEKSIVDLFPFIQLPEGIPQRVFDLSDEITDDAEDNREKAELVEDFLGQEYAYQVDMPAHDQEEDFVDQFLFEHQEGYCTHFASAMAVLLRAQEVPTRYVEGYRVPYYPEEDDYIDVDVGEARHVEQMIAQENHAHAWVEVFLQGYGWVVFEPTQPYEISGTLLDGDEGLDQDLPDDGEQEIDLDESQDETISFTLFNRYLVSIIALIALVGGASTYTGIFRLSTVSDLYYKLILLRSIYGHPPKPGDTPGKILTELKEEFPELGDKFDECKMVYEYNCYALKQDGTIITSPSSSNKLVDLLWQTIKAYRKKLGFFEFISGMLKFALMIFKERFLRAIKLQFHSECLF